MNYRIYHKFDLSKYDFQLNLNVKNKKCTDATESIYDKLINANIEVLYDDRDTRAGNKFADADLIGLPWQLIVGPRKLNDNLVEIKNRSTGERTDFMLDTALSKFIS